MPSLGYRISGKEVEVCDSGSRHHQLCGCCNLQLIQSHVWHLVTAHQQESFLPFSSWQSLSCCLSCVAKRSTPKPHGPLLFTQNHVVLSIHSRTTWPSPLWLPSLGLNPSAHLPLQPHFRLLLQSVIPASIPVFFQLYWASIVSLGRCGPMAWSQSSPSSPTGPVTRGSCFPVPSWVEFAPIPLAQSMATAI